MLIQTALFCGIVLGRLVSGHHGSGEPAAAIFRIGDSLFCRLKQHAPIYQTPRCHVQESLSTELTAFTPDVSCHPTQMVCRYK